MTTGLAAASLLTPKSKKSLYTFRSSEDVKVTSRTLQMKNRKYLQDNWHFIFRESCFLQKPLSNFFLLSFYFKNKPNRGTIVRRKDSKTRCALPPLICIRNVCLWGNKLWDKRAIDCHDGSLFCPLIKMKGWTQYQMFY